MLASEPEVMVALMGPTGTGKSTFINLLTKDEGIRIGHDLESQTIDINVASYTVDNRRVTLVDTPGFDDSRQGVTDTDILAKIANFLQENGGRELNGIIYLHRISDPRMGGAAKKNLRMFRGLCGDKNLKNVRIVTTHWSAVDKQEGTSRQTALAKGAFKPLIKSGAKFIAHDRELESARQIVSELIQQTPVKLKIQDELDAGRVLANTSAGGVIMEEMKEVQQKHNKEMKDLKKEMEDAAMENNEDLEAELAEERRQLQKAIAQVEKDRQRMEMMRIAQGPRSKQERKTTVDREVAPGGGSTSQALRDTKSGKLAPPYQGSEDVESFTVEYEATQQIPLQLTVQEQLALAHREMREMQWTHTKAMEDLKKDMDAVKAKNKNLQAELAEERRKRMDLVQLPVEEDWNRIFDPGETRSQLDRKDGKEERLELQVGEAKFARDKGKGKAVTSSMTQVLPDTTSKLHTRAKRESRGDGHHGSHGSSNSLDRATVIFKLLVVVVGLALRFIVIRLLID